MIAASVGIGTAENAYKAGAEACADALENLPDKKAHLLLVFGSISFDQDKLIEGVAAMAPGVPMVGCSTAGEISTEGLSTSKTVVIMAIHSDQMRVHTAAGHHILWNSRQAGAELASTIQYNSHNYASSALVFADVIAGGGEETILGLQDRLGMSFPLFGGAASDDLLFFETYQYLDGKVFSGSAVGVGFSGDYHIAGMLTHGFFPIGLSHKVTRSQGGTLYELDGEPAVSVYTDYFGEEHVGELREGLLSNLAVNYPLGVFLPGSSDAIIRTPVFVDRKGAMTFTAAIPEGSEVRLMISGKEEGLASAEAAAKDLLAALGGQKPKAVLIINSVARKKMLGLDADEEVHIIQNTIGRDVPMAGFYSYAQVGGPYTDRVPFHNGGILILALAE